MIINGKEIESFKEDTKEDLFYRISVSFDKLYECISEIKDDKVLFLDELIEEYKGSFEDFYKTLPFFPFIQNDILIHLWLLYKKEDDSEKFNNYPSLRKFLIENKWSKSYIDDFNRENFLKFIKKRKKIIKSKVEENDKIYKEIELLEEQKHTEFKKQRYNIYFLSEFTFSLDYLYNNMKCNKNVPFMSFKNICKIDQSFNYDKDWEESYDNKIILKLYIETQFITSIISIDSNVLKFEIIIDYEFKEEIDFRKYIKDVFLIPIEFNEKTDEYDIYGLYYFPKFYFNKYILSHLIMTEPLISKFLSVDESIKASTKKSGILTKFNGGLIDGKEVDVSCNIICKKVDKNDIEIKNYHFLPGSYYVRLRLSRFKDKDTILYFISFISKILTIYEKKKNDIFSLYQKHKITLEKEKEEEPKEEKKILKNIQPALFVSGYTRKCESDRQPEILDKKDTEDLEEYTDYIQYPEDEYYYHCGNNPTYPNIGLMVNSLSNMNEYPYLPCCYKERKNNNNNIDLYYKNEEKKDHKQQLVILTLHRLLPKGHYGEIPTNLKQMLSSLFDYSFFRLGVSDTKQSFLECIQKALNKKVSISSLSIASQENPDLSIEEMEILYKNKNKYLDPRRWIKLLEHFYKCHIYVFTRKHKDKFVNLLVPFHSGPYLEYNKSYDKTVIILENQDGRTGEYRCELVVKKNKEKYDLFFSEKLPIKITQFYLTLDKKPIINYFNEPNLPIPIKSQVLDSLKKTRCLITTTNVCLLCDPIPPLDLPIEERTNFNSDPKDIEKLKDINLFPFKTKVETEINNELSNYLKTKKIAFILGEFFIYLFSSFYKDKEENNIIKLIKEFIDKCVSLKNPSYKIIPSSIIDKDIMKKCGYFKNDKIIVKDNETLKRLICLLRLRIMNSLNEVQNYYKSNEFFHFYKDISDFNSNQNILIYNKDLSKIEKYDTTVYYTFQLLPIYYLVIKGTLYISKKMKNEIDLNDYFITLYNQELEIINQKGNPSDEKLTLIEYNKEYQQLFLL